MVRDKREKNLVIRASAGSGKTYQLTNRLMALIFEGVPPESILATTFSRKAAGEILDRLLLRLAEAAGDAHRCEQLRRELSLDSLNPQKCTDALRRLIGSFHQLNVRTLDSFFVQAAQVLSLELGLWPDWRIDEGDETDQLTATILGELLQEEKNAQEWVHLLFKGQAVRSITEQLKGLIQQYYERVFLDSAEEAWHQLQAPTVLQTEQLGEAVRNLERFSPSLTHKSLASALRGDLERIQNQDWQGFLDTGLAGKIARGETRYNRAEIPAEMVASYRVIIDHARAVLARRVVDQTLATYRLLEAFDCRYQEALRSRNILRFSDVTRILRDCLRTDPEARKIWERRLGWKIEHLLLDEFQDTSTHQWAVLFPLAEEICRSLQGTFFCVGDNKQSIYGWRGSEPGIFSQIESELPDVVVASLDTSWRSSPEVIHLVNSVFTSLKNSPLVADPDANPAFVQAVDQWLKRFSLHQTARLNYRGYCCVIVRDRHGDITEDGGNGDGDVTGVMPEDPLLVRWVSEVYQAPGAPTIGILVRKNESIQPIVAQLRAAGLRVSQEGRNPVTASTAVQLILNVLRIADHPGDTAAAFRVGFSPLARFLQWETYPEWDEKRRLAEAEGLSLRIRQWLLDEGYAAVVGGLADALAPWAPREEHPWLEKLVELAILYDERPTIRTQDFLRWLDHQTVTDPQLARIRVMTIHGAKGLQFDAVFLPDLDRLVGRRQGDVIYTRPGPGKPIDWVCRGLNQKLLETGVFDAGVSERYRAFQRRCFEEDLSLLYVALTRAVYGLYIFVKPVQEKATKPPRTFAGIICASLGLELPRNHGDILLEEGARDWWRHLPALTSSPALAAGPPQRSARKDFAERPRRSLPWTSPHEAEGAGLSPEVVLRFRPVESMARGNLFHAWFSQIGWLDRDGLPDEQTLHAIFLRQPDLNEDFTTLHEEFIALLGQPVIRGVLSFDHYCQSDRILKSLPIHQTDGLTSPSWRLYREQSFVVVLEKTYCRGQFDRLVVLYDGDKALAADVIDFKTDRVSKEELPARLSFYAPQMRLYREAAAQWLGISPCQITAHLVFVHPGVVERVA